MCGDVEALAGPDLEQEVTRTRTEALILVRTRRDVHAPSKSSATLCTPYELQAMSIASGLNEDAVLAP